MRPTRLGSLFLATGIGLAACSGSVTRVGLATDQRRPARPPPAADTARATLDQHAAVRRGDVEANVTGTTTGNPPGGSGFFVQRDGGQVDVQRGKVSWVPPALVDEHYTYDPRRGWMLSIGPGYPTWAAWEMKYRVPAAPPAPVQLEPQEPALAADRVLDPPETQKYIESASPREPVSKQFAPMRKR